MIKSLAIVFVGTLFLTGCSEKTGNDSKEETTEEYYEGVYVPKDLNDCFVELMKILSPNDINTIKNNSEDGMISYHFSLGIWIRNNWGLWQDSRLSKWFNKKEIYHPDDMSGIILVSFHRHLKDKNIKLKEQIEDHVKYWEEMEAFEKRKVSKDVKKLFEEINRGDLEKIRFLIDKGVPVDSANEDGDLALVAAIKSGHFDIVVYLIEKGADVNARDVIPDRKWPVILDAAAFGYIEIVKYLVENGADFTVTDDFGRTALMNAVIFKKLDIVKYLIEDKGMDINAKNAYGHTALVFLFKEIKEEGTFEILKYIIENGADIDIKDSSGRTLLDMAIFYNDQRLIDLLKSKGESD